MLVTNGARRPGALLAGGCGLGGCGLSVGAARCGPRGELVSATLNRPSREGGIANAVTVPSHPILWAQRLCGSTTWLCSIISGVMSLRRFAFRVLCCLHFVRETDGNRRPGTRARPTPTVRTRTRMWGPRDHVSHDCDSEVFSIPANGLLVPFTAVTDIPNQRHDCMGMIITH